VGAGVAPGVVVDDGVPVVGVPVVGVPVVGIPVVGVPVVGVPVVGVPVVGVPVVGVPVVGVPVVGVRPGRAGISGELGGATAANGVSSAPPATSWARSSRTGMAHPMLAFEDLLASGSKLIISKVPSGSTCVVGSRFQP
jgi:hypothetical protein